LKFRLEHARRVIVSDADQVRGARTYHGDRICFKAASLLIRNIAMQLLDRSALCPSSLRFEMMAGHKFEDDEAQS
jgi:hypothetical protein